MRLNPARRRRRIGSGAAPRIVTADERVALVRAKSDRAKKHIAELQKAVLEFLNSEPYKVGAKRDPQTRNLIYYVTSVRNTPQAIPVIIGDILQCFRSTLDHLAYQLMLVSGAGFDEHKVRFPVGRDFNSYKSERGRVVPSLRKDAQDAIDAVEPYAGGKGALLWTLHNLNNIDKHRTILTAGASVRSVDLGRLLFEEMRRIPNSPLPANFVSPQVFFRPADKGFPLKAGQELLILGPDDEPDEKQQFRFEVAFAESEVVEGKPISETLHEITNLIDGIVTTFHGVGLLT